MMYDTLILMRPMQAANVLTHRLKVDKENYGGFIKKIYRMESRAIQTIRKLCLIGDSDMNKSFQWE